MAQTAVNRREYFRIDLTGLVGTMQVIQVAGRQVNAEPKEVRILNAGGGGLGILFQDDLAIRMGIIAIFNFNLGGCDFSLRGELIRKLDDRKEYRYGVEFIDLDPKQQDTLISVLGRLQLERERNLKHR